MSNPKLEPYRYEDLDIEPIYEKRWDNGRGFFLGELRTAVEGHEEETHAVRFLTPVQDVTFLICDADMDLFGLVAWVLNGRQNIVEDFFPMMLKGVFDKYG